MKSVSLTAFPRTLAQRGGSKKLRANGRVPAVIYGRHNPPQNLEVRLHEIELLLQHAISENVLVDLAVEGDPHAKRLAMLQQIQHHPLSGKVLHVDFHEVAENEKVTITVPVEAIGEAQGVKDGGVLEHVLFKLKVRGLPKDLPELIEADVTHLQIGQAVHIGDIKTAPGVEVLGDKKISVLAVAAPVTEEQEAAATAAAEGPAEPEVIKEKKEEGEGEAAPAGKGEKGAPAKGGEKGAPAKADKAGAEKAAPAPAEKKAEKKK